MEKISAIKGVKDILPPVTRIWQRVDQVARNTFHRYGYEEILIPIFESTRLFSRSIGEATDIVEKEMYTFEDRGGKTITLRPEGTASVARAYIEHNLHIASPYQKFYYIGPMFRRERPQAGRYRQFYQIGAEAFGVAHPGMDAEIISMIHAFFQALQIGNVTLLINSLGCSECRPAYRAALQDYLNDREEALCPDCQRRLRLNPLRVLDCKVGSCKEIAAGTPRTLDFLCPSCQTHHEILTKQLHLLEVPYTTHPLLVRGLDYYTRTVFEFVSTSLGAQNTVAAGGRYDRLVQELGGPPTPAVGFSLGIERLLQLIADDNPLPENRLGLFIAVLGPEAYELAIPLLQSLRQRGLSAALDHEGGNLKSQMRKADRLQARYVVILGENEIKNGTVQLRDMAVKQQEEVKFSELVEFLLRKMS